MCVCTSVFAVCMCVCVCLCLCVFLSVCVSVCVLCVLCVLSVCLCLLVRVRSPSSFHSVHRTPELSQALPQYVVVVVDLLSLCVCVCGRSPSTPLTALIGIGKMARPGALFARHATDGCPRFSEIHRVDALCYKLLLCLFISHFFFLRFVVLLSGCHSQHTYSDTNTQRLTHIIAN